jgi:predicted alpha/beta-hydrolase family hydrolase
MTNPEPRPISIPLPNGTVVSGLLCVPDAARAACVLAHGAGAGMFHPFMAATAELLARRGIATLRPIPLHGARRPDPPVLAHEAVRAAVAEAARQLPRLHPFAGGKSFGGRMTSQAQAEAPLPGVEGLVFLGFPLHAAQRTSFDRAQHLGNIRIPMLFLQGSRDALAKHDLITRVVEGLGSRVTLITFADADHSFHVPARSGRTDAQVLADVCDAMAGWMIGD